MTEVPDSYPLSFDGIPPLHRAEALRRVASHLWLRDDVVALWLGGSLARGEADAYSDIDLRVAVSGADLRAWSSTEASTLVGETVVGEQSLAWEGSVLRHLALGSGELLDLLVQDAGRQPPEDATLVLGCRDDGLAERLAKARLPLPSIEDAAPEVVRQAVVGFWMGSIKHAKVLHRGLDLLVLVGLATEQSALLRLWSVAATGRDLGPQRPTIHTLTETVRSSEAYVGSEGLAVLGMPKRDRKEIVASIERHRDEVANIGRILAERLGFDYPEALERTVRDSWHLFIESRSTIETPS